MHHHLGALTVEEVHLCRGPEGKNKCFSNSSTTTLENVLRGKKSSAYPTLFTHNLQFNTKCWTWEGGRGIQNNTKKTNQLLGSPLTDEPENRKQTSGESNYSHIVADDDDGKQEVQTFLPGQQLVIIVLLVISRPVVHHFPLGTHFCPRTRKQYKSHLLWVFLLNAWCRCSDFTLSLWWRCLYSPPGQYTSVLPPLLRGAQTVSVGSVCIKSTTNICFYRM